MQSPKWLLLFLPGLLLISTLRATNLRITQVEASHSRVKGGPEGFNLHISWENSWRNEKNHDAAWIFFKFQSGDGYQHAYLKPASARMLWKEEEAMPDAAFKVSDDGAGMFVYPSEEYRGRLHYRVFVEMDTNQVDVNRWLRFGNYEELRGYGLEMVYIPEGSFTLGDPDTAALGEGAYYRSGANGAFGGLFEITSADQSIPVGPESGNLYYRVAQPQYQGDQKGPVPATFPSGGPRNSAYGYRAARTAPK